MKRNKASKKVALGGVVSALSLLFMFLTGIFPFAEYALPAISGIALVVLVIELDKKTAYIAYIAVGILSMLVAPVKESAVLFVFFLGFYPILKSSVEQIKSIVLEWTVKMGLFNLAIVAAYLSMTYLLGMSEVLADLSGGFKYGILVFWLLGNATFVLYDIALSQLVVMYFKKIQPKLKKVIR